MQLRLKRKLLGLSRRLAEALPQSVSIWVWNRCPPWRPVLDVVEVHLADACNLNCNGCLHFSPRCKPYLATLAEVENEFRLLKDKFPAVRHVHLLGGEPLLNARCADIVRLVRRLCPETRLSLVTNGLLLLRQGPDFWRSVRETRTLLDMTRYLVTDATTVAEIERKCREEGVVLRLTECEKFLDKILAAGTADPRLSFKNCRQTQYCPYLRNGRLYPCATSYHVADGIPGAERDRGISVRDHSPREILTYLQTPSPVCRHCRENPSLVDWSRT